MNIIYRIKYLISKTIERIYSIIIDIINKIFSLIEILLFLRLGLKFLGANPQTLIVSFIYKYSDILVLPFNSIFSNIYWPKGMVIETTTISAMIGYSIIFFIIFQILNLFSKN